MQDTFVALKSRFEKANISSNLYSFDGYKEDAICVETDSNGEWLVYEAINGKKIKLQSFKKEKDACIYFLLRARELKVVTEKDGIPLPLIVKDIKPDDTVPRFIDVVKLMNEALHSYMSHEHKEYYDISKALIVDAECVVRCEKCKYKRTALGKPYCLNENGLKKITNDTYCCYGEEK